MLTSLRRIVAALALTTLTAGAPAGIKVEIDGHVVQRNGVDVVLASGQAVRIQINGDFGSTAALDAGLILPGEMPLATLTPMTNFHTIRLFDEAVTFVIDDPGTGDGHYTNPVSSIGKVVIEGTADQAVAPFLRVIVKAAAGMTFDPGVSIPDRGAVNFGVTAGTPSAA